jgi:hypothetical protein
MRALLFLSLLAACAPERPQEPETPLQSQAAAPEDVPAAPGDSAPPPPPSSPPAPSALPGLQPLSQAQVVAALGSGASCALGDGGQLLMVAVPGAAVINDGRRIVRLEAAAKDWTALLEGGVFTGEGVSVEVDVGAVLAREGEVTVYDANTLLKRGHRGFGTSHGPSWSCGA